jgi:murein DD-endopeptidase MepM/ murein hydrolase activator NlpD
MQEANFGPPRESLYVLPYPVGDAYIINQTYCSGISHWFGYDFGMPIGSRIVAARGGTVQEARDDLPDDGIMHDAETDNSGNVVTILHDDGSLATYAHMAEDSLVVSPGDTVATGELIGLSGYSGNADRPHLHFDVIDGNGLLLPINFRNSRGKLVPRGWLMQAVFYEAMRY